jgi:hypothetical protein
MGLWFAAPPPRVPGPAPWCRALHRTDEPPAVDDRAFGRDPGRTLLEPASERVSLHIAVRVQALWRTLRLTNVRRDELLVAAIKRQHGLQSSESSGDSAVAGPTGTNTPDAPARRLHEFGGTSRALTLSDATLFKARRRPLEEAGRPAPAEPSSRPRRATSPSRHVCRLLTAPATAALLTRLTQRINDHDP